MSPGLAGRILIAAGDWTASILPAAGGAIGSLDWTGRPILSRPPAAAYPMIPSANRIARGRFRFGGVDHALNVDGPAAPNSLHGIGWRRAWDVAKADARSCHLTLRHRPAGPKDPDWPFAFDADQWLTLDPEGLTVRLSVTNAGAAPAPAGLGFHPWFRRRLGETLTFRSEGVWLSGPDLLPTVRSPSEAAAFAAGRRVCGEMIDNDFFGWDGVAHLDAPEGPRLRLSADPVFSLLRLYTPGRGDAYAVEPVTHRADAINDPDLADGAMTVLAPGASLAGDIAIRLETSP